MFMLIFIERGSKNYFTWFTKLFYGLTKLYYKAHKTKLLCSQNYITGITKLNYQSPIIKLPCTQIFTNKCTKVRYRAHKITLRNKKKCSSRILYHYRPKKLYYRAHKFTLEASKFTLRS
jgi:hypothetical protein